MRVTPSFALAVLFTAACPLASADWISTQRTLGDLSKANTSTYLRSNCTVLSAPTSPTGSTKLSFGGQYASFGQSWTTAQDWSAYNMVYFVMTNDSASPLTMKLIVQLQASKDSYTNAFTGEFYLPAGMRKEFLCYLNVDDPKALKLKYLNPPLTNSTTDVVAGTKFRDLKTVYHWRFSLQDSSTRKVTISDMRLMRQKLDLTGLVDKYGQYTDRTWPTKVNYDSDFSTRKNTESVDLNNHPGTGETLGTNQIANPSPTSGKWKVVTLPNGRKMLQHPNTKLFWSLGMNGVVDSLSTRTQDRTNYFKSLPDPSGRFASCYAVLSTPDGSKTCYSFRKQNLMLKYGDSYLTAWTANAKKRLSSWGINTVGIDSHKSLYNTTVPFVLELSTSGFSKRFRPPSMKWGSFPDPYDAGFVSWCLSRFKSDLSSYAASTNLMGAFVDNELSWGTMSSNASRYNLALGALTASATQPAKIAFVQKLSEKYVTIAALNRAWGTAFASFDDLLNTTTWKPTTYTAGMQVDFQSFCGTFAYKYFWGINYALKNAGLKSLYMGARFDDHTTEVVNAAGGNVDVLSFNVYDYAEFVPWAYFNSLAKPVIISEFGFGLKGWGTFGGPAPMYVPDGRAYRLQTFLDAAIQQPNVVGVQYYCWGDQPITGRWSDYENGGFGMVDVADVPYQASVDAFRNFAQNMYAVRAGATGGGGGTTTGGSTTGTTGGTTTTGGSTTTGGGTTSTGGTGGIG